METKRCEKGSDDSPSNAIFIIIFLFCSGFCGEWCNKQMHRKLPRRCRHDKTDSSVIIYAFAFLFKHENSKLLMGEKKETEGKLNVLLKCSQKGYETCCWREWWALLNCGLLLNCQLILFNYPKEEKETSRKMPESRKP